MRFVHFKSIAARRFKTGGQSFLSYIISHLPQIVIINPCNFCGFCRCFLLRKDKNGLSFAECCAIMSASSETSARRKKNTEALEKKERICDETDELQYRHLGTSHCPVRKSCTRRSNGCCVFAACSQSRLRSCGRTSSSLKKKPLVSAIISGPCASQPSAEKDRQEQTCRKP